MHNKRTVNPDENVNRQQRSKVYGIPTFPTCIILDKAGKVIYAGGFDKDAIAKLVAGHL